MSEELCIQFCLGNANIKILSVTTDECREVQRTVLWYLLLHRNMKEKITAADCISKGTHQPTKSLDNLISTLLFSEFLSSR